MATRTHADGVELRIDGGESQPIHPFLERFVWRESLIEGGFTWQADIKASTWQEWTPILLGKGRLIFEYRLTTQVDGQDISTEWRRAITDSSRSSFRGQTLIASAVGGDRRLEMMQAHRLRAWPGAAVSDVARVLAQEYGLNAAAQGTADVGDRLQVQESDWAFLRRIAYETSASGRGDVFLWMDNDTLHLRAPDLQRPADRHHDMSLVENRVDRMAVRYAGREVDRRGGATLQGWGFDWDARQGLVFNLDSNASRTHPALAGRVPRRQSGGLRYFPVIERTLPEVEGQTRGRWGRFAPRYFSLRVDTRPDLSLRPGTILEMEASLGENQETPLLGRFLVLEVQHEMVDASIITTAVCYRREASAGEEEAQGNSAGRIRDRDPFNLSQPVQRTVLRAEVLP